ncbi:MAG: filamentous hemagglutinin N-terminal domain-containing protein [Cyanobacteria bacterium SIG29]|nr:filamentous hemagglutinin N-terminal domain-containing protein [Cyanobacteria bacterium SIG29]
MRKLLSAAVALGVLASTTFAPAVFADVAAGALPNLNSATNADVTIGTNNNMNIQINGGQGGLGTLNWNSYNVGKDASVNYEFTAHNQTALNNVSATGGLSQIYGKITSSGCSGCGYDATGKVILINPNGVLFGDGANVNLNSFTATTFDASFDKNTNKLQLDRNGKTSKYGIVVMEGADIYGGKAVNLVSDNITQYAGSKISTSVAPNANGNVDSLGKVKLVTADGVNFAYYNNGAVKALSNLKTAANKMMISLNGEIKSGNIDARNYSAHKDSQINLYGANLKAVKAVSGNDGNIWLTSLNDVITENTSMTTSDYSTAAASRDGGNVKITAGNKVSLNKNGIGTVGKVDISSQNYDVNVNNTTITAAKDINVTAGKIASVQTGSILNGKNVNINGATRAQVNNSTVKAVEDVNLVSAGTMVWGNKANITAGKDINATASNGYLLLNDSVMNAKNNINLTSKDAITTAKLAGTTFTAGKDVNLTSTADSILLTSTSQFKPISLLNLNGAKNVEINAENSLTTEKTTIKAGENVFLTSAKGDVNVKDSTKFLAGKKIYIQGANDVKTTGIVDVNNIQTNIIAGRNVDVKLANVGNRNNGLVAKAGQDMTVTTAGTLSVSSLISGKDMTINANKVIAGLPYTTEQKLPGDASERSYIEVGGEFTSNVANDNYVVTQSGDRTDDGKYNQRHHIQYGNQEKILLVNKRPVDNNVTDPNMPGVDNGDDVDVINPGETPADPNPTPTPTPTPNPDPNPEPDPTPNPNPGEGEECPDTPNDDVIEDEDAPELLSTKDLLNYSAGTTKQKRI